MPEIAPFRGLRFNAAKVPDPSRVVTPPYDVISRQDQERYYARHPHNVIRLILAKGGGGGGEERYAEAARTYRDWLEAGVLVRDPEPALYLHEQEFVAPGDGGRRRRGLICLARLHDYREGVVFAHEQTFIHYRKDRLALLRACPANLSQVLAFYPGPRRAVDALFDHVAAGPPAVTVRDDEGGSHRLWVLTGAATIRALAAELKERPLIIADGHHRYETALAFRDEMRALDDAPAPLRLRRTYNYMMMMLVSGEDPGLVILPTHRIVRQMPVPWETLRAEIARWFDLETHPLSAGLPALVAALDRVGREQPSLLFYPGGDEGLLARLRSLPPEGEAVRGPLRDLDVSLLHGLVLGRLAGYSPEGRDAIEYTRDADAAVAAVREGEARLAVLLNPPDPGRIQAVAMAGLRMPQKSTYFYPKLLTGLVINPIHPDEVVDFSA